MQQPENNLPSREEVEEDRNQSINILVFKRAIGNSIKQLKIEQETFEITSII